MNKEEIVNVLIESANENGLIPTLYQVFGKSVKVRIPFSVKSCNLSVDDLDFSPRAEHSLKRAGVFTVDGVINLISNDELICIRNLGKKTQNEIKTIILSWGYEDLSDFEKKRFFYDVLERNCI
jgi:DNA-directed RNA polymerase alpha subunit